MNTEAAPAGTAVDALILCGGLGSRLRPLIADRPKGLVTVAGKPVLDILVDDLLRQGLRRIVFCVGHMKEQIVAHFEARDDADYAFSGEESPLGTGGAIRNALPLVRSETMLVMNGDSWCPFDFARLLDLHRTRAASATLVLTRADERRDCGSVAMAADGRILSFVEKAGDVTPGHGYINAGIYLLQTAVFAHLRKPPPFSLEYDVFPALAADGRCYGLVVDGEVVDIGTPERYLKANAD